MLHSSILVVVCEKGVVFPNVDNVDLETRQEVCMMPVSCRSDLLTITCRNLQSPADSKGLSTFPFNLRLEPLMLALGVPSTGLRFFNISLTTMEKFDYPVIGLRIRVADMTKDLECEAYITKQDKATFFQRRSIP